MSLWIGYSAKAAPAEAEKPSSTRQVFGELSRTPGMRTRRQNFHRDEPVQPRLARQIDHSCASAAEFAHHFVSPNPHGFRRSRCAGRGSS